jgi:peptidyl-prolyl cis-trans isomerase D
MFAFLRKLIVPIMATVLVFFLATIIFQWGMNITSKSGNVARDAAGLINGEDISIQLYDRYYNNLLRQEQDKSESDLPDEKMAEIRGQAWQQLVSDFLINKEIEKHNIFISDEELYSFLRMYPPQELQTTPQFITDGKFDYQKYVSAMANPQYASFWAQVEGYVTPELKKYKLQEQVINNVRVSPTEVMDAFLEDKESIKIGYINVAANMAGVPEPSSDDIKKYYDEHPDKFKREKRATIDLVVFQKAATENDWQKVNYQIKDIYDSAMAGSDFAELARNYSEDNSATNGGDIGWFGHGQLTKPFDSAAWLLQPNEISRPFRTNFGWHIVKLIEKKMEKTPNAAGVETEQEKAHAAHILLKVKPSQESLDQLALNAKDFSEKAQLEGFEKTAKESNYEIKNVPSFGVNEAIRFLGNNPTANRFAFENDPGKVSDVIEVTNSYYVIKVGSHLPAGVAPLTEVQAMIIQALKQEKAIATALGQAQNLYNSIKSGMMMDQVAKTNNLNYIESQPMTRKLAQSQLGRAPEVIGTAFGLKNIGEVSPPVSSNTGAFIIKLLDKSSPPLEDFNRVQDSVKTAVLQKKQQDYYSRWFDGLVKNSKIENDVDRIYGGS